MQVNEVLQKNTQGFRVKHENEDVPLKNLLKCGHCGGGMPGYMVKKKNIWYYKCRVKGCRNNKSAKQIHEVFMEHILAHLSLDQKFAGLVKEVMLRTYSQLTEATADNTALLRQNLLAVEQKLDKLEERFILAEITADQFSRFGEKFKAGKAVILEELGKTGIQVSNPEKYIDEIIGYSLNLAETWASASYQEKQKIQNLVFPEGIAYDKKNDKCRTSKINWTFLWIARQQQDLADKKTGIPGLNLEYASLVELEGVEPSSGDGTVMLSTRLLSFNCREQASRIRANPEP